MEFTSIKLLGKSEAGKRDYHTEDEQKAYVSAWDKSKLSQRAFCKDTGLHPKTFSRWVNKYKLKLEKKEAEPSRISEQSGKVYSFRVDFPNNISFCCATTVNASVLKQMIDVIASCK